MSDLAALAARAADDRLELLGYCPVRPEDGLSVTDGTIVLLGPAEPGFWAHVTAQPEWTDGRPDPVDHWSRRTIGRIACDLGAKAVFPFGGPPWRPFYTWALRSGWAWTSPVTLLVHRTQGLMVSFRGAVVLPGALPPAEPERSPCDSCAGRPCLSACPPGALTGAGYDVPACHDFLDGPAGESCRNGGCLVRRACPISQGYGRLARQSAYHMGQFHR